MTYTIPEDVYNRLDGAKPVKSNNYDPYISVGNGDFSVVAIEPFVHDTHGPSARVTFIVNSHSNPAAPPGSRCVQTYNFAKGPKWAGGETDVDRFADLVMKLKGAPPNHPVGQDIRALLKPRAEGGRLEEQLARGMRIKCFGKDVYAGKPGHKPFVKPTWITVPDQTPQSISEMRAKIEVHLQANPLPPTGKSQTGGYQNQSQYQAQPQYAPPPAQMPAAAPPAPAGGFLSTLGPPPGTQGGNGGGNGGSTPPVSGW